jgi:hypothetical protein
MELANALIEQCREPDLSDIVGVIIAPFVAVIDD